MLKMAVVAEDPVTFWSLNSPPFTASTTVPVSAVCRMSMSPDWRLWRRTLASGIGSILISSR